MHWCVFIRFYGESLYIVPRVFADSTFTLLLICSLIMAIFYFRGIRYRLLCIYFLGDILGCISILLFLSKKQSSGGLSVLWNITLFLLLDFWLMNFWNFWIALCALFLLCLIRMLLAAF